MCTRPHCSPQCVVKKTTKHCFRASQHTQPKKVSQKLVCLSSETDTAVIRVVFIPAIHLGMKQREEHEKSAPVALFLISSTLEGRHLFLSQSAQPDNRPPCPAHHGCTWEAVELHHFQPHRYHHHIFAHMFLVNKARLQTNTPQSSPCCLAEF